MDMEKENQIIDGYEDDTTTTAFGDKIQAFMDEVYSEWQKEENKGKSKWDVLDGFPAAYQIAVVFGNFNYQVENGGLEQWIYNGYFHDDAEKFTEYLEAGVGLDDRCRTILDRIYKLDQYARETDCDRNGYYRDPDDEDGEGGFIGNLMNCDAFDTWYYGHCGKEDWWETVCRTIEKAEEHGLAPFRQNGHDRKNAAEPDFGGFTAPLPSMQEQLTAPEGKPPEKESVIAKIRAAKAQPGPERKPKTTHKSQELEL